MTVLYIDMNLISNIEIEKGAGCAVTELSSETLVDAFANYRYTPAALDILPDFIGLKQP